MCALTTHSLPRRLTSRVWPSSCTTTKSRCRSHSLVRRRPNEVRTDYMRPAGRDRSGRLLRQLRPSPRGHRAHNDSRHRTDCVSPTSHELTRITFGVDSQPGRSRYSLRLRRCPRSIRRRSCSTDPSVPEEKRFCSGERLRRTGRPAARRRAGSHRGVLPKCGHPFSFTPKLAPGDVVGGPVRDRRLSRARRARLDLPRPDRKLERPVGRAEGDAEHR